MHVQLHSKTASLIIAQNIMLIPVISVSATPASSFICVKDVSFSRIISSNVFLSELIMEENLLRNDRGGNSVWDKTL